MDRTQKDNMLAKVLGNVDQAKLQRLPLDTAPAPENGVANFSHLMDEANRIAENSRDYRSPFSGLFVTAEEAEDHQWLKLNLQDDNQPKSLDFSLHGLNALCAALDIPANYIRRCIETGNVDFAQKNLNFWLRRAEDRNNLIRVTNDRVHGVLSDRYTILDDHEVLEITNELTRGFPGDYVATNGLVTPELTKVRIIQQEKIVVNGDELSVGFDVRNSRVGKSSLDISLLMFRWICANGMIMGGGQGMAFQKRHVGISRDDLASSMADVMESMPRMIEYVKTSVEKAQGMKLNSENIQQLIDKFKAAGLSKNAAGRIESFMDEQYDRTLYGFVNTLTDLSKEYSIDTREKMERFAGQIFEQKTA